MTGSDIMRKPDGLQRTHINLTEDDVHDAPDHEEEVEHVPGVSKVTLQMKSKTWVLEKNVLVFACGIKQSGITFALKAMSLTIISMVKRTVKMTFRVFDSLVMYSDWSQCCDTAAFMTSVNNSDCALGKVSTNTNNSNTSNWMSNELCSDWLRLIGYR